MNEATLEELEKAYREGWQDGYHANFFGLSDSEKETATDWEASDTLANATMEGKR